MKRKRIVIGLISAAAMFVAGFVLLTFPPHRAISKVAKDAKAMMYPGFGIWLPPDYEVHGIDVSRHQRKIDWESVSEHTHNNVGINFAFIKASEGRSIRDNYFDENWKAAKENNILRGAYHFFRPHLTPEEQFSLFKSQVKLDKEDLPPVLDVELRGSCPPARLKKNVKRWLVMAEKQYGVKPILYTSYSFYKHYFSGKEFQGYHLWIAHYATEDLNRLTEKWNFWQHNESGRVKGIRGDVDFNVFKGDYDDLLKMCKK